jgi:hypothetical protein
MGSPSALCTFCIEIHYVPMASLRASFRLSIQLLKDTSRQFQHRYRSPVLSPSPEAPRILVMVLPFNRKSHSKNDSDAPWTSVVTENDPIFKADSKRDVVVM